MSTTRDRSLRSLALGVATMTLLATAASAESAKTYPKRVSPDEGLVAQVKPKGETPRMSDGHPDLSGFWGRGPLDAPYQRFGPRGLAYLEPDQAVMQRGNAWGRPEYKPEYWDKVYNLDYGKVTDDPSFLCMPLGTPRMNMPEVIVARPGEMVTINGSYVPTTRLIPTDGRKPSAEDLDNENFNGVPTGHWDGDTLVVDSVGFNDKTWMLWTGYFHSNKMTVQERFRRVGDVLYYSYTVTDPEVLVHPWTSPTYLRRLASETASRLEEVPPCRDMDINNIADLYFRG